MSNTTSALDTKEAYELIRTIYKFIPTYNQIKGTYLGIQFVLNTMGLCTKITELWRNRIGVDNFATDGTLYREDELGAVRRFVQDIGKYKAAVSDYYLTSRFDVDLIANKGISFYEFNGMAKTIIEVINDMRPVTRCLRRLFFIILVNTDIHYNYYLDAENELYSGSEEEPEHTIIGHLVTPSTHDDDGHVDETYGLQIRTFNYLWNVNTPPWDKKIAYDDKLYMLNSLYLPWNAIGAKLTDPKADSPTEDDLYDSRYLNTMKNTYFNLFELDRKLEKSHQLSFQFIIYARKKDEFRTIIKNEFKELVIGEDVTFKPDKNGIYVYFHNTIQTILGSLYRDLDITTVDLFFGTNFNIVLGTKYIYQDPNNPLDIWDINEENSENIGLISETSEVPADICWLVDEATGQQTLLWESYK